MEYEKPIQATSFSKKLSNGGLMASSKAHPYDGVFVNGGRSGKLRSSGAVVDGSDYAEIFRAGSTSCSIPVLDIPELFDQGTSTSGGGRSSRPVDYSKIFAGLGDSADFAVPFEELLPPKKPNISNGASTRTSAETRTRSRSRSRQLSFSEEKLEPSLRPSEQLLPGVEEFNVLHNRTGPGSENAESRTAREAERSVFDDARVGDSVGELPRIPKLLRRAVSGPQPRVDVCDASQRYVGSRRRSSRSGSMSNDMFDAFDNGVGVHSSGMPSPSSAGSKAHNYAGASRTNMPEREQSNCSPSFSEDEVDGNSIAAVSAAAVSKAIEEAQARIKFAKELMERKKEGRLNFAKMNSGKGFKADKKVARTKMLNTSREKGEQTSTFIARMSNHGQRIPGQVSPDFTDEKEFSTAQASGGLHEKEPLSCPLGKTAEAYGNERAGTGGSQSDSAVKRDSEGTEVTGENTKQGKITREIETMPGIFQWKFDANSFKSAQELEHEEEHDLEVRSVHDQVGEADQATNLADEHEPEEEELESKLEEFEVEEGNDTKDMLESQGDNQNMPEMGEAIGGAETIDHETEGCSRNLEDTGLDEVLVIQNNEIRLYETNLLDGKPRGLESTECQDHREESSSPGADEYRESNGLWEQNNDMKYVEICDEHVIELRFNDLHGKEESNRGEGEDGLSDHDKDTVAMGEQILDTDHQIDMRESQLEGSSEADRKHSPTRLSTGGKEDMEVPPQASMNEDGEHVDSDDRYNQDEIENFRETEEGGWYEETLEGVSVTAERMESPEDANGTEESDKECEGSEDANGTVEDGFDAVPHSQVFTNLEHTMQGSESLDTMNNAESAADTDLWSQQKQDEGLLNVHDQVTHVEEVVCESDESDGDIDDSEVGHNEEVDESDIVSEEMIEPQTTCVLPERTVEEVQETVKSSDVEENNVTDEYDIASTHGEDESVSIHGEEDNASQSSHDGHIGNQMHVETFEQPSSSEGVVRMTEVKFQSSENKEESPRKAERKEEVASQSEAWIQNIRNLEKDELKEKARQRIVVDRAIKEARERAFAETRERAERAAADKAAAQARQRETAEASKMPEKTPSEANATADRAAKNAKLKAERAAVERATNEARERALEKALAEKDAAKARNQAAKTAAEKFSSVPRDDAAKYGNNRSYGHQQNNNVTSSSSRQPSSSHHAAPYPAEKSGVPNNVHESSYWSKATLEQHQRTAERAAKALAEKKMRDLLAQREQAERHRLAETLDADVKRWLNGKERNLRALLATLQYILGSDSGWQPIPLTDLVSSAAVKKAYRKATLVVHPDKLQQRGASIQQKYTCEKVFDLLKEAWNKFSAEEK